MQRILGVVLVGLLGVLGWLVYGQQKPNVKGDTANHFMGRVIAVSKDIVGYKNSKIVSVAAGEMLYIVYVTEETKITDTQGKEVERERIKKDQIVSVDSRPTEGGVEALSIRVVK